MDIEHYREFIELAQQLNFTKAATHLNMTQPALSKHIASIEREYGIELIKRSRGNVQLTEAGKVFFEGANIIVEQHEKTKEAITRIKENTPIRIGGQFDDADVASLIAVTAMCARNDQSAHVTFVKVNEDKAFEALSDGVIDLYIDYTKADKDLHTDLSTIPFITHNLTAIVGSDHRLANRESIEIKELQDETFVKFVSGKTDPAWNQIEAICHEHGFEPKIRSVPCASDVEFFSTPLGKSVLVWKKGQKQIGLLLRAGRRASIPISDESAVLVSYASYRSADKQKLLPFFAALQEAKDLIRKGGAETESALGEH